MKDIFTGDIFEKIEPPHDVSFKIVGTALPTNQDMYFVAKWHEIFERYTSARLFVRKALEDNWDYWFNKMEDEKVQCAIEYKFKAELYETALLSYNILVDLSWAWTYVSAEYLLYNFDADGNVTNAKDVCGMHPIEEAYELLRKTENGVSTPHAEGNPFNYLKVMRPEFSDAVDTIVDFWKVFSNSSIRNLYNFVKHKGKTSTSISVDEDGEIDTNTSWSERFKSKASLSIHGIEVPYNLFPDYSNRMSKAVLKIPFPFSFRLDIGVNSDLNLNSARDQIIYDEKWLTFEENLYRIICRRLKDTLSSSDWKILNEIIQKNNTDTFSRVANSFE